MFASDGYFLSPTLDPNQSYNAKQMMSAFARMERFGIALIEQPVPAADWAGLALLTRSLPCAIEVHPVEIKRAIGHNRAALEPPVPAAVEGGSGFGLGRNPLGYARRYFVGNCRRFRW